MSKIFISAGHGGSDSGAVGNGYKEKDLNLQLALELGSFLTKAGHTVIQNRTSDLNGFGTVVQTANKSGADAFLEIHLNAGGGTGSEAFYYQHDALDKPGPRMAAAICKQLSGEFGWRNRGAKKAQGNYDFKVVRETTMPANLVEVCFIDSASDMQRFNVARAAKAIARGVCEIWGKTVEETKPAPAPNTKAIGTGDTVKIKANARSYEGATMASFVYDRMFRVSSIGPKEDRVVLDKTGINTAFHMDDLTKIPDVDVENKIPTPEPAGIAVGDMVRVVSGAKDYSGGGLASFVYQKAYYVQQLRGDRAVIGPQKSGSVTAAIHTSNLVKQ